MSRLLQVYYGNYSGATPILIKLMSLDDFLNKVCKSKLDQEAPITEDSPCANYTTMHGNFGLSENY